MKKLTIGMIVKNEEKTLKRALDSIKPLLENNDVELIITDTGSTDRTVEIAEKYADKLLHFKWNDDFAAARNTGIEVAEGEWFFQLDADEWFEDTKELEAFFLSGEYRKYNSVAVRMYSFSDKEMKNYSQTFIARAFRLEPDTKYEGAIHEKVRIKTPCKILDTTLYHSGYILDDVEGKRKKTERNLPILLSEYEKSKMDPETLFELVNQYIYMGELETAVTFTKECKMAAETNQEGNYSHLLYRAIIEIYFKRKEYKRGIGYIENYFSKDRNSNPIELDIRFYAAIMYIAENNYNEGVLHMKAFINIYDKIINHKFEDRQLLNGFTYFFTETHRTQVWEMLKVLAPNEIRE